MRIEETSYFLDHSTTTRIVPKRDIELGPPLLREFAMDNHIVSMTVETTNSKIFKAAKYTKIED